MKTLLAFSLVGATAALATGCIKKDDGITDSEAKSAGDALGTGIEDSAKGFSPVAQGAMLAPGCVTLSGNTADTDADSIPAAATLTFNCTAMALGYTGMLTGTLMVTDDQPAAKAWAFTGTADLHASLTGPLGGSAVRDQMGSLVGAEPSAGTFTLHRMLDATTVFTGGGAQHQMTTVTEDNDWTATFKPTVTWSAGETSVSGTLDVSGSWNVTVNAHDFEATLATPTPLQLDPNCDSRVTAGHVTATYGSDEHLHTIDVVFTGCGTHTVTKT